MAKYRERYISVEGDLADYGYWIVDTPDKEDLEAAFFDLDRARACLSARAPNIQEALLRLERSLPILSTVMEKLE